VASFTTTSTYMIMPASVADMMPSGIDLRGCARSPDRPTPAVMPVNAGNTIAKTSMNASGLGRFVVNAIVAGRISSGPVPRKKTASEAPRMLATTQSALTPRSAPLRSTTVTRAAVAGSETMRGSNGRPVACSNNPPSGWNASAKAIM
jgi:hypothetical protein